MKKSNKPVDKVKEIGKKVLKHDENKPKGPITSVNIEKHREATIETAKKYKYPFQQARQKILIWASIAFVVVLLVFSVFSWWMLYVKQDTGDFYYTATRIIPIPVANVDGENVPYGDYMRRVRASIFYLENQENRDLSTEDGQRELNYTRRVNLDEIERVVYARKIAREQKISISEKDVDDSVEKTLGTNTDGAISERAFENSIWRYYGWDMNDYRRIVRERLTLREAMFAVDQSALTKINDAKTRLDQGVSFPDVVAEFSDDENAENNGGEFGAVGIDSIDSNGLIEVAQTLSVGNASEIIKGVDAYYIIRLLEKTDTTVRYAQIRVSLSEFDKQFSELIKQEKIKEFITIQLDEQEDE